jgi:hypothetical protein
VNQNLKSSDFYQNLPSFSNTSELISASHYSVIPEDWWVVMTDVRGATKAIQEGRYKDVNTVGVGGIISVQNALVGREFPFVFGGDGASLLIHDLELQRALKALAHTRQIAKDQFQFELRIAAVPVRELIKAGRTVRVAKLELSPENHIALFQGGGLGLAEKWMKDPGSKYLIAEDQSQKGEHTGLECRWNPIPSQKSQILALIVQTRDHVTDSDLIYTKILEEILSGVSNLRPITLENLPVGWPPKNLSSELRLKYSARLRRLWARIRALSFTALAYFVLRLKKNDAQSEVGRYVHQLVQNTDFIKFDDCLRMIVDVDVAQIERINAVLKKHFAAQEIYYGTHMADNALMTCFVQSPKRHIHFVDADQGGYAMAAKMLKSQRV